MNWKSVIIFCNAIGIFLITLSILVAYHNIDLIITVCNMSDPTLANNPKSFDEIYSMSVNMLYFAMWIAILILLSNIVWILKD